MMRFSLVCLVWFCFLAGCKESPKKVPKIEVKTYAPSAITYPEKAIAIPKEREAEYIQNFFLPWNQSSEVLLKELKTFPGKELTYLDAYLGDDAWYGENKKPHKKAARQKLVANADAANFPNFQRKGITVAHTNLRRLHTRRPGFDVYSKAGEGYPFDYFQETNLWANTPLQLLHLTQDKQWCYAVSPYYKGWVPMTAVGLVDAQFMSQWKTANYAMPLSDDLSLTNSTSPYAVNAKIGMVVPFEEIPEDNDHLLGYYATTDAQQNAVIVKGKLPKNKVALDGFMFHQKHLEALVSQLIGKPYGWGGHLENRDCSSMIRDLMATFKIWLPRDSKDQIAIGKQWELTGSKAEKLSLIKEHAIPFLTILRKKGHNMLYVGNNADGEPLIFHAIWGLKTAYENESLAAMLETYPIEGIHKDKDGSLKGRHIIGESVITSVLAGEGYETALAIIDEIYAMTNFLE